MPMSLPRAFAIATTLLSTFFLAEANALKLKQDEGFKASSTVVFTITGTLKHDVQSFTEGLVVCNGTMIESVGLYGVSALIRRQIGGDEVLARYPLPASAFGEGATCFGDRVYQLTWREHAALVYDNALELVEVLHYAGEGWGLTHDDRQLIMSDGSATISFRDAADFSINKTIDVHDGATPITRLNELEYAHGLIFANIWQQDRIAIIDPADGAVLGWLELGELAQRFAKPANWDASDDVLNGIAYDATRDRYYVTGKRWPLMFELKLSRLPHATGAPGKGP
ncbi:glutaminyl-peptide cyclotransferase [Solimonas terrae]|uniref:Glutaminyl-peptide cyclotransferase n=1 Tax=Solimonas terrae TaxID=1396819 RepID=A0A6M2BR29_9GAMM|nr:glutaminyl-peptide cyclotransferase [Solimonas terrae]NGY05056.1 glutaminyl-peptide cyclotransferase [Solimonas terrae]